MNRYAIMAILAVAVSSSVIALFGLYDMTTLFVLPAASPEHAAILGHVEYIVKDSNNKVKQYMQTDNVITAMGKNCAAQALFDSTSMAQCTVPDRTPSTNGFNWIAISNTAASVASYSNTTITLRGTGAYTSTSQGSVAITTPGSSSPAVVTIQKQFAFNKDNATTIRVSGLLDKSGGNLFALQILSPQPTMQAGDTLTIKWNINIG